jgi:eukaryotic-like serine/threonine-protein kinase
VADLTTGLQQSLGDSYTIERELGGGGMSRVFIAEDVSLGRRVALKVLPPDLAGPLNADRFRREILLAARLQDPHIVPVLSAGQTADGTPYYTMPLVDGESLRARLARHGAMPIADTLRILRDVAKALAYAHELGVVHRDIKPDNVLLTRRDALVADFGVAKALSSARDEVPNPTLTVAGTALGTPAYMAPEQIAADPNMDHRADLYAFGAMAYEMVTGRPPFIASAPQRILAAHLSQKPEDVSGLRPDTPPGLASLIMRCLAKEPGERPQSASEALEELDSLITSGGYAAGPAMALASKRSFGRALAIYAVSFAAVAILARAAVVGIGLPYWVFTGALVLMALGLPVLLFIGLVHHHSRAAQATLARTPGGSTAPHSTMTQLSLKAQPHFTWRRMFVGGSLAMGVFVLAVAGYMAMRLMGIGPAGSLLAAGVLDQRAPVLVAEFENNSSDSLLGSVVTEAFRTDLAQSRAVTAVQPVFIEEALRRMQRAPNTRLAAPVARELATREGIRLLVEGDVTSVGAGYLLAARLVSPASGEVLAAFRETANSGEQLIPAIDRLSKRVREKIGESIRSVRGSPGLEQVTTGSLEALRKYTQALDPGTDYDRGLELLKEAVAADTTFAMAYRRLGTMYSNRGEAARAREMITRAYMYRERLPALERYLTEGSYWGTAMADRARAISAYEAALEVSPTNRVALNNVALLYAQEGEHGRAEQYLIRAIEADSMFAGGYTNLAVGQVRLGKLAEARATMDAGLRWFPQMPEMIIMDLNLRYQMGDTTVDQRIASFVEGLRSPSDRITAFGLTVAVALRQGRLRDASQMRAEIAPLARSRVGSPGFIDVNFRLDSLEALAQLTRTHVTADLERVVRSAQFRNLPAHERPYLRIAGTSAMTGRTDLARQMLRSWEEQADDVQRVQNEETVSAIRAAISFGDRRYAEAIQQIRSIPAGNCVTCRLPYLGLTYDSAGVADSVIAVYERYLTTPEAFRLNSDAWFKAPIHERLAQLYERRGDRARALAHYTAFVNEWREADPELQPRVRAARTAIARLQRSS